MVISTNSLFDEYFVRDYDNVVIYEGSEQDTVIHEGEARLLANGWVELPTGRLLSPNTVHHIDIQSEK